MEQLQDSYPQLAFPIDNEALFDHRDYQAMKTVHTNPEGRFVFGKLPFGEYIIVYSKDGCGYNYYFGLNLDKDLMDLSDTDHLTLYAEVLMPGVISGDFILESDKCYIISDPCSRYMNRYS